MYSPVAYHTLLCQWQFPIAVSRRSSTKDHKTLIRHRVPGTAEWSYRRVTGNNTQCYVNALSDTTVMFWQPINVNRKRQCLLSQRRLTPVRSCASSRNVKFVVVFSFDSCWRSDSTNIVCLQRCFHINLRSCFILETI